MAKEVEVEVVRGFHGAAGEKVAGDRFDYDFEGDPQNLKELGLVKLAPKSKG